VLNIGITHANSGISASRAAFHPGLQNDKGRLGVHGVPPGQQHSGIGLLRTTMRRTLAVTFAFLVFTFLTFAKTTLLPSRRRPRVHLCGERTSAPVLCPRAFETR
jgi:hypothetical protein